MIKEKLVAPPTSVLPPVGVIHRGHPLLELSKLTTAHAIRRQQAGVFDIKASLDANNVIVVGQKAENLDCFAGKFVTADVYKGSHDPDWFIQQLLKGTALYLNNPSIKTFDDKELAVRIRGLVFPQLFEDRDAQNAILTKYLNPERLIQIPKTPQIFTFSSSFNPALDDWHFSHNPGFVEGLPSEKLEQFANDFILGGLEVLAHESDNRYIRQAAARLADLRARGRVAVNIAMDPSYTLNHDFRVPEERVDAYLPSETTVPYLPNMDYAPANIQGFIVLPHNWIIAAGERPVVALAHLLYAASLVRDHSFGKLEGTQIEGSRWGAFEISHSDQSKKRAGSMTAQFLMEATDYDHKRYGIRLNLDPFSHDLLRKYPFGTANNHHYDDPPQGRFNNRDNEPGNGPDDNFSNSPTRPSSLIRRG